MIASETASESVHHDNDTNRTMFLPMVTDKNTPTILFPRDLRQPAKRLKLTAKSISTA